VLTLGTQIIIALAIGFLATVGVIGVIRPQAVWPFWQGFASSRLVNTIEATLRGTIGAAIVIDAESFLRPEFATIAGWFLIISAAVIGVFYELHHSFAQRVVPPIRHVLRPYSLASVALAGFLIWAWRPLT